MSTPHQNPHLDQNPELSAPYTHTIENPAPWWTQWPMIVILTLIWCSLWQDFRIGTMMVGAAASLLIMWFYRLPPVPFAGRFNPWYALVFTVVFLHRIVMASLQVAWDAIVIGPRIVNSVVAVKLRSHDDLIVTLTGHALALIPGSLVIDVDRPTSTLFLHVIDIRSDEDVEHFRAESLAVEAHIIRAVGSREDFELVREEDRAKDGVIRRHPELIPEEEMNAVIQLEKRRQEGAE